MAKHPVYYPDPQKNFNKLQELISLLLDYSFMHDFVYDEMQSIMQKLYMSKQEIDEIENGDDPFSDWPSLHDLFLREENKEQFIQDFRNVIGFHMQFGPFHSDTEEAVDNIIEKRDLDYYRSFIVDRD